MDRRASRRLLLDMAHRRQRPGSGSALDFLRTRTATAVPLDMSFLPVPWCLVGAVAARLYMPERLTQDLDIAVVATDGPACRSALEANGFQYVQELGIDPDLGITGSSWRSPAGEPVDVLELHGPWADAAVRAAQDNRDPRGCPVLPLPHLVLLKLAASRTQGLGDLARMLGLASRADLQRVRAAVRRWAPADSADLESLIHLGQIETGGPGGIEP